MKILACPLADYWRIESDCGRRVMGKDGRWKGIKSTPTEEWAKFATPNQAREFWAKRKGRDIG